MAIWLWTILLRGETCQPYNVGSEESITIAELAETVAKIFQPAVDIQIAGEAAPDKPAERYVPSTQRAQVELGLRQTVDLQETIRQTTDWHSYL